MLVRTTYQRIIFSYHSMITGIRQNVQRIRSSPPSHDVVTGKLCTMRIPSDFNDENLYRGRGRRLGTSHAIRRVMRMSVALVLVVVVMNTASKEAIYRPFFPETVVRRDGESPLVGPANADAIHNAPSVSDEYWFFPSPPESQSRSVDFSADTSESRLIASVLRALPRGDRLEWGLAINRFAAGDWQAPMPSSLELLRREIDSNEAASTQHKLALTQALNRLSRERSRSIQSNQGPPAEASSVDPTPVTNNVPTTMERPDRQWMMAVYREIFAGILDQSIDGTVWRSSDRDALRLLLEQAKWDAHAGLASHRPIGKRVGVIPLLQQPKVYIGKRVRVRGVVARIEQINAENPEGDVGDTTAMPVYYQLWLRPTDGADRPMIAVVDRIPNALTQLDPLELIDDGPEVSVIGTFLKRLAYPSGKGADLAPVIVGTLGGRAARRSQDLNASSVETEAELVGDRQGLFVMVVASVVLGLLIAALIMWRTHITAVRTRALRKAKQASKITLPNVLILLFAACAAGLPCQGTTIAEDVPMGLRLVSGFDTDRLDRVYPFDQPEAVAESAKLLDRLRRVSAETLQSHATMLGPTAVPERGSVAQFTAKLQSTQLVRVPEDLAGYLEFSTVSYSKFEVMGAGHEPLQVQVVSVPLSSQAKQGDEFSMTGVLVSPAVGLGTSPTYSITAGLVCPMVRWYPAGSASPSHAFLASQGFDMSWITRLTRRDRKPLSSLDSDAFYELMRIASQPAVAVKPETVSPVRLLRDSKKKIGTLISIPLETVQVIRVEVTEPSRRKQLGQNHYFQIDAMGDLEGAVRIEILPTVENPNGGEVLFENRYPVSIVTRQLPDFLAKELGESVADPAIQRDVRVRMQLEGYFFRLWSYSSELMDEYGDNQQFGPLIVASRFQNLEVSGTDPIGVRWIGWGAACFLSISMMAIFTWHRLTSRDDARIRQQRSAKEITNPIE